MVHHIVQKHGEQNEIQGRRKIAREREGGSGVERRAPKGKSK